MNRRPALPAAFAVCFAVALGLGWQLGAASGPSARLEPDAIQPFPRTALTNLTRLVDHQAEIPWQPFRPGIEIHRLYGNGTNGPAAALLRFQPGAKVPRHTHGGFEHILVLEGSQRDQNGRLDAGTLAIHPPGSTHSVVSDTGCLVLAIYEKPVRFDPASQ